MFKHIVFLFALFISKSAMACAVCFGGADSKYIRGFTWGVGLLLVLPFLLMGGLVSLIYFSAKKHKRHEIRP
jgi:hypothetical protein